MFRGFMPALTLVVFGIGMGIGLAWSRGLIPLSVTPAKSGSLSPEFMVREPLPPPDEPQAQLATQDANETLNSRADVEELVKNQTEPDIDDVTSITLTDSSEPDRSPVNAAYSQRDSSPSNEVVERSNSADTSPTDRIRLRDRNAVKFNESADVEDALRPAKGRKVIATAHQDPSESATDDRDSPRDNPQTRQSPQEQLKAAEELLENGETLAAHRRLSRIYWNHKEFRPQLQEIIDSTANAIFFQPKPHYVDPYVVRDGERLEAIAKKYQLSWEYIAKLNGTKPKRIQAGQKLKVMKGPFGAMIDLKDFVLTVHLQGYYVRRYEVGIGKDSSSPVGQFTVKNKVENPEYTDGQTGIVTAADDPKNPLGERWIDLGDGYGIHGTIDPNSIGKAESRGCIRLRDRDIVEVYDFVVKGSEVVLR